MIGPISNTLRGKRRELRPGFVVAKTGSKLINQFSFVANLREQIILNSDRLYLMMLLHFWHTGVRELPVTVSARCTSEFRSCGCGCGVGRSGPGPLEGAAPTFGRPRQAKKKNIMS